MTPDFGLVEIQRQAGNAVAEVDHLVEHRVGQAFDLGDAVANLADDAHILFGSRRLRARDLRFNFLQKVSHRSFTPIHELRILNSTGPYGSGLPGVPAGGLKTVFQCGQPGPHAAIIHIAAHFDAHPPDQLRAMGEQDGDPGPV